MSSSIFDARDRANDGAAVEPPARLDWWNPNPFDPANWPAPDAADRAPLGAMGWFDHECFRSGEPRPTVERFI